MQLADYFKNITPEEPEADVSRLLSMLHEDLESGYPAANEAAGVKPDRGALRALVWGERVSRIVNSIYRGMKRKGMRCWSTQIFMFVISVVLFT